MKFKFVKKGTKVSSEQVNQFMNFGQVMDKAAGMGAAPLAKGALATKTAAASKALWIAALPVTAAVYLGITELISEPPAMVSEEVTPQVEMVQEPEPVLPDTTITDVAATTPVQATPATPATDADEEEEPDQTQTNAQDDEDPEERLIKEDIMIKAEPVGGFEAFYETIDKELTYPESARISHIEGMVRVSFVVDKDGKAGKFAVVKSLGTDFDKEALRVMRKLTEWKPATHNGQPVSSHLSIKLRFELEKE